MIPIRKNNKLKIYVVIGTVGAAETAKSAVRVTVRAEIVT